MMFDPPKVIETKVFARVPDTKLLEGPSFDRAGNLYVVDIPNGRVFRIAPDGKVKTIAEYDGEPNGLKIHKNGQIFIADHKQGLLTLDPETGSISVFVDRPHGERFKGLNDLVFARNGDLYFTDQGESGLHDPTGRLYRLRASGQLEVLLANIPSPNGLVLTPDESILYFAVTRGNSIWRVPLLPDGRIGRVGVWVQMSGGIGPDGMAIDVEGRVVVAHPGMGAAWIFSKQGEPVYRVRSCTDVFVTNVAYGGPSRQTLYMTEAYSGAVLSAGLDVPGYPMFSHVD